MMNKEWVIRKKDIIFGFVFLLILILQIWKAHIGTGYRDEHFYISLGYRFYQGDALFYDDWHIAQMIGFFITPLYTLYRNIFGSNEGIVLGFRYYYIVFTMLVGLCIYIRFRSKYNIYAIFASSVYMLYTPLSIMALSYNTMSVGFLLLSLLSYKKENYIRLFISGFLYACAVVNTPYLVLCYLAIIYFFIKKKLNLKEFLSITLGIFVVATTFFVFVFSRESLSTFLSSLKYLVDPSHSTNIFVLFAKNGAKLIIAFGPVFALLLFELIYFWKNKANLNNKVMNVLLTISLFSIIYISFIHPYQKTLGGHALALFPIALLGIIILWNKDDYQYEKLIFFTSIFHAFVISISSNVGPRSYCSPLITADMIVMLLFKDIDCTTYLKNLTKYFLIAILVYYKITNVFCGTDEYNVKIEKGPLKGLYDRQKDIDEYYQTLNDIEYINSLEGEYINCTTYNTWEYLASNKICAANSTYIYFWYFDQYENAFDLYHSIHHDKDAWIYIDDVSELNNETEWISQFIKVEDLENGSLYRFND